MRRNSISFKLVAIVLLLTLLLVSVISFNLAFTQSGEKEAVKKKVAVIAKSTSSDFWQSVKAGAEVASSEYNLELLFEGPENEEDYMTQNDMVRQAVEEGVDAIVFSAVDYEANAETISYAAEQGVVIIGIDSDVNSSQVLCKIGTDNYEAGKMTGQAVLDWIEQTGNTARVGIVNFDKNSENGQARERGFLEQVEGCHNVEIVETINVLSKTLEAKKGVEYMLRANKQINVVVTFNEWTSLGVGYAIQDMGIKDDTCVIAFDSNLVSVAMLETGEVDGLIVQNPYAMGYLGIENAYYAINGQALKNNRIDTSTLLITRENMYDDQSQQALFAFGE